jgi:hypothetical protein
MGAVNGLFRRGWNKDMLQPGDMVTLGDGRKMSGGTASDAPGN